MLPIHGSHSNNNGDHYNGIIAAVIFIIETPGFQGAMADQI